MNGQIKGGVAERGEYINSVGQNVGLLSSVFLNGLYDLISPANRAETALLPLNRPTDGYNSQGKHTIRTGTHMIDPARACARDCVGYWVEYTSN